MKAETICPHGLHMPTRCDDCERIAEASYPRTYQALQRFRRAAPSLALTQRQALALHDLVMAALLEGAAGERAHWQSVVSALAIPGIPGSPPDPPRRGKP